MCIICAFLQEAQAIKIFGSVFRIVHFPNLYFRIFFTSREICPGTSSFTSISQPTTMTKSTPKITAKTSPGNMYPFVKSSQLSK